MAARTKKKAAKKRTKKKPLSRRGKKRIGRPPHQPTDRDRHQVETMSGLGMTHEEISIVLGIARQTLENHYPDELKSGGPKVKAKIVGALVKKAMSDDHPQSATCAIFYLKCRAGWREKTVVEHEGINGVLVAPSMVEPADWIREQQRKNSGKKSPEER